MNPKFTIFLAVLPLLAAGDAAAQYDQPDPPPVVEIQINRTPETTDDYVTWGPTVCRARVQGAGGRNVPVVLTNDAEADFPGGGDVLFAAFQSPWPANKTATEPTLALKLPADGSWVPFILAGKFGKPSANDKDAVIEAHLAGEVGETTDTVLGKQALMVRVRSRPR